MNNQSNLVKATKGFRFSLVRLSILILALTGEAFAQFQFTVSGNGRVFYEPDAYDLSFAVVVDDQDIQKCKTAHIVVLAKVKEALDANKEKTLSLKQDATRLERVQANDNRARFFRFTTSYVARVSDVKSLLPLQESLISAGVTDITALDMISERLPRLLEQARKEAIKDAKAKAELAATELGWALNGASNISFQEAEWIGQKASIAYGVRTYDYDSSKRPDQTTYVTSQVSITFAFEKKR